VYAAGLTVVIALTAAACSSSPTRPSSSGTTTSSTTAASTSSTTSTTIAASTTTTTSSAVQNLPVTSSVRATLTSVFVSYKQIQASDVSGTVPNSVYYAYDPASKTYWAMASFMPSSTASQQILVGFQDGGNTGLYKMATGGSWAVSQSGVPPYCAEQRYFPQPVLAAWGMGTVPAGLVC
jgi:hypothetical protein